LLIVNKPVKQSASYNNRKASYLVIRMKRISLGLAVLALGLVIVTALVIGSACNSKVSVPTASAPATTMSAADLALPEYLRELPPETKQVLLHDTAGTVLANIYRDITAQAGIDFTYHNGQDAGHYAILESLGGGVGLIDYDGDGLLDIYLTGGGYYDGPEKKEIKGYPNRLYKNLGNGKFRDVTAEVGLDKPLFYTHGCAVADYNRDGWPDLLVTGWGQVVLYRNESDGKGGRRFRDVSKEAGLTEPFWSTSAGWADFDGDGWPDVYVCQYVNWSMENNPKCTGYTPDIPRDVCPPKKFSGQPHHLFRNNGDGTFRDVSKEAKLRPHTGDKDKDAESGKGLGVVVTDLDGDRKPDIYVANDTVDNFLYINRSTPGKILFEEVGMPWGVARDDRGVPNGSMGTDAGDYDHSGFPSLWVTTYENEMHALHRNRGNGIFTYSTQASGIAAIGQFWVGFGTGFLDIDNHGSEDLIISNGHVIRFPTATTLQQRPVLLRNKGAGRFADITKQGGDYFRGQHIGRGVAIGDLDNRGRPDLVISHLNEPVVLLRNEADTGNNWLGLELVGKDRRDVTGAKVIVEAGNQKWTNFTKGGSSYLSSCDRRLLFGIGKTAAIDRVRVIWPWGQEQTWAGKDLAVGHYWRLLEGKSDPEVPLYERPKKP
jgi:hypothetical protein